MKLLSKFIDKDQSGKVHIRLDDDDDIWHAYNLINEGDHVRALAVRRITSESATGSTDSHRVKLNLTIAAKKITFSATPSSSDPTSGIAPSASSAAPAALAGSSAATLHISGPIVSENKHVKQGAFHTIDLEPGRDITIIKEEGGWDTVAQERLIDVVDSASGKGAEVGGIVCGDGVATVCLITEHTTVIKQRIDVAVPRKRKGGIASSGIDKATDRFHRQVYDALMRHFDFSTLKVLFIASPGFVKEAVSQYIFAEAARTNNKTILVAKPKFLLLHSPSHHVHSLMEVLASPEVSARLKDTKFAREGQVLQKFFKMMDTDPLRTWYGEDHVFKAAERGAIGTLMISDGLFRSADPNRRKRFVKLVEDVKTVGAEVLIFSSMHESGEQLNQLTGIAALLTYPLDVELVEEEEREIARVENAT